MAYLLSMLLWPENHGAEYDLRAKDLLVEAADDDPALAVLNNRGVSLSREHVFHMLWRYVWPIWHEARPVSPPEPRTDIHHCASLTGVKVTGTP